MLKRMIDNLDDGIYPWESGSLDWDRAEVIRMCDHTLQAPGTPAVLRDDAGQQIFSIPADMYNAFEYNAWFRDECVT